LASARLAGQTLRYVAELAGQWVALVCFGAAALDLKGREQWIRWTPRQRVRRLPLAVNNSRFPVLSGRQRYPNLASRVLGLCLRRLSDDWQAHWGHLVLAVESFVDESRYRGPSNSIGANCAPVLAPCCAAAGCRKVWPSTRRTSPTPVRSVLANWVRS